MYGLPTRQPSGPESVPGATIRWHQNWREGDSAHDREHGDHSVNSGIGPSPRTSARAGTDTAIPGLSSYGSSYREERAPPPRAGRQNVPDEASSGRTTKTELGGHYILTAWGCGAECLMGAVIDANSGKVYWLPHTICCWGAEVDDRFRPIEYRLDSRLIVFSGLRDEKEGDDGTHFYEFDNGKFIKLASIMKEKR